MNLRGLLWAAALASSSLTASHAQSPEAGHGLFDGRSDIGTVTPPGAAEYNPERRSYAIRSSGANMWAKADDFHFVWKKVSGDVTLSADVAFLTKGGNAHKKAVLMVRQSLDTDSAYGDAALHGDGLTSLQTRDARGADTHEIQSSLAAPKRLRISKHGQLVYLSVAEDGAVLRLAGGAMQVLLQDPYYVGIGVCAHDKDAVEGAVFSDVELTSTRPGSSGNLVRYSTLETVPVASTDRRAVHITNELLEAASWSPDGASLLFTGNGRRQQVARTGGKPALLNSGPAQRREPSPDGQYVYFHSSRGGRTQIRRAKPDGSGEEPVTQDEFDNRDPHLSPDGQRMAFLSTAPGSAGTAEFGEAVLRVMTLSDHGVRVMGKLLAGKGTLSAPCWSPDGKSLAFVSYQRIPAER